MIYETLRTKGQFAVGTTCGSFSANEEAGVVRWAGDWLSVCEAIDAKGVTATNYTESFGEVSDRYQNITVSARVTNRGEV